jgi:hypothetical protein
MQASSDDCKQCKPPLHKTKNTKQADRKNNNVKLNKNRLIQRTTFAQLSMQTIILEFNPDIHIELFLQTDMFQVKKAIMTSEIIIINIAKFHLKCESTNTLVRVHQRSQHHFKKMKHPLPKTE